MATGTVLIPLQSVKLPTSNPCQINADTLTFSLLYDATTGESGSWSFRMPTNYSSALVIKIQYSMASATSGGVAFDVSIAAVTPLDAEDAQLAGFASVNTGTDTVPATAGYMQEISISLTNADSLAAQDLVILKVARDPTNGTDTATGDAEVLAISLEYTSA